MIRQLLFQELLVLMAVAQKADWAVHAAARRRVRAFYAAAGWRWPARHIQVATENKGCGIIWVHIASWIRKSARYPSNRRWHK